MTYTYAKEDLYVIVLICEEYFYASVFIFEGGLYTRELIRQAGVYIRGEPIRELTYKLNGVHMCERGLYTDACRCFIYSYDAL